MSNRPQLCTLCGNLAEMPISKVAYQKSNTGVEVDTTVYLCIDCSTKTFPMPIPIDQEEESPLGLLWVARLALVLLILIFATLFFGLVVWYN